MSIKTQSDLFKAINTVYSGGPALTPSQISDATILCSTPITTCRASPSGAQTQICTPFGGTFTTPLKTACDAYVALLAAAGNVSEVANVYTQACANAQTANSNTPLEECACINPVGSSTLVEAYNQVIDYFKSDPDPTHLQKVLERKPCWYPACALGATASGFLVPPPPSDVNCAEDICRIIEDVVSP